MDRRRHVRHRQRGRLRRRGRRRGRHPQLHPVRPSGRVEYEAGNAFEHEIVRAGHYPEARSENKGNEPEGLEVGRFGGRTYLFVASERANVVGVYDVTGRPAAVRAARSRPASGPEGICTSDGLLAVTAEVDGADEGFLARPIITLFELARGDPAYPDIASADDATGLPIPWVAHVGPRRRPGRRATRCGRSATPCLAQALPVPGRRSDEPAVITERIAVGGVGRGRPAPRRLRPRGRRPPGPRAASGSPARGGPTPAAHGPNLIVRTEPAGAVLDAVELPPALAAGATSSGFEGVAVTGTERAGGDEVVWVAVQREWADDPAGLVKLGRYDVADRRRGRSPTTRSTPSSRRPAGSSACRSSRCCPTARWRSSSATTSSDRTPASSGSTRVDPGVGRLRAARPSRCRCWTRRCCSTSSTTSTPPASPCPTSSRVWASRATGEVFVVTDNDGVDENYGETVFLSLGSFG